MTPCRYAGLRNNVDGKCYKRNGKREKTPKKCSYTLESIEKQLRFRVRNSHSLQTELKNFTTSKLIIYQATWL